LTKKKIQDSAHEDEAKQIKKLGPIATCFTIMKGFVGTGVLYIPKDFKNGGYIFAPITLIVSMFVTLYCAGLLIKTHDKVGGSFPEMGEKAYGRPGKIFVEVCLVASQFSFCIAYVYFIASQIGAAGGVIPCITGDNSQCDGGTIINRWIWLPICMVIYVPLVMVRRIEVFAATHFFGDCMIIITIIILFIYAGANINKNGIQMEGIAPAGPFLGTAIGFSVYTYEGIGVIIPIKEVTACEKDYYKLLCITVSLIATVYVIFGEVTLLAWGSTPNFDLPLITSSLPDTSVVTYIVKILFSFNMVCTYPLMIHPANLVVESWFFGSWEKSRKRQMCKNFSRTIIVGLSCVIALGVFNTLDLFLGLTGALTCIPVAFMIPTACHYKLVAIPNNDKKAKIIDLTILALSVITLIYCTYSSIVAFFK